MELCLLCETRKPRRYCPASRGDICSQCCGAEREVTVDCPLDCEFLLEARKHEKQHHIGSENHPHKDVNVTEAFLERNEQLFGYVSYSVYQAAMQTPGATDADIREALGAVIKTYRTLDSGLIYETRPANPYADSIQQRVRASVQELQQRVYEETGVHSVRDNDVMGVLVFMDRIAMTFDNRRRRCRAFLSSLHASFGGAAGRGEEPQAPSIIVP